MKLLKNIKFLYNEQGDLQDTIFLVGILLFLSILLIGLLPGEPVNTIVSQEFIIYSVMLIPVVAAIYFIIISFRRNLYSESSGITSNIRKKMLLAFVFVAVLPSLPIVFASNYIVKQTVARLSFDEMSNTLSVARDMSVKPLYDINTYFTNELETLSHFYSKGTFSALTVKGRKDISDYYRVRNISVTFCSVHYRDRLRLIETEKPHATDVEKRIVNLYNVLDFSKSKNINRISIDEAGYITGFIEKDDIVTIIYREIPPSITENLKLFEASFRDFRKIEYIGEYLQNNTSFFLILLSMFLVIISVIVSHYLAAFITRPVLELSEAANEIASGNFSINLKRDSDDELGILYKSFNHMIDDLNRNRKVMYQKQRLEAWKDMARKVVHEIKNPLTPIRLSAERMRKHCLEDNPEVKNTILIGTETIIEEVISLMNLLNEFTNFARLPEMKPKKENLGSVIENSVGLFEGHENIEIKIDIDNNIPEIYIDKNLIKRALGNLIQNAIEALGDKGLIQIKVTCDSKTEPGVVTISVSDNGPGITEKDMERIFEPGFSRKASGTGLGLAIVEKIILEHQGNISCRSEYGQGSEFIIELPIINEGVFLNG